MATETQTPTRRAYKGSCHCGLTQYIAYITLPPSIVSTDRTIATPSSTTRIRRCNCSTCQKTSSFHVGLTDSPNDFYLLSPIMDSSSEGATGGIKTGEGGLKDYTCFEGNIHWYFCSKCGVRCFNITGEGEVRDVEVEGQVAKAWTPKREGWREGHQYNCYFSLNATSIEPGQESFDMREWTEKGWVVYLDCLNEVEEDRLGKPFNGGMY